MPISVLLKGGGSLIPHDDKLILLLKKKKTIYWPKGVADLIPMEDKFK